MRTRYIAGALLIFTLSIGNAAEPSQSSAPKFLGSPTCSSTSCHGGASERNNQVLIWSKLDYHSRSYASLTSARSERFADILKLGDATKSSRCTVCHAPFQTVDEQRRLPSAKPVHGVSCESCHAPAENWLRSHTRPDFSHQDRVAAGMRDLKDLYVRANTCVACHQNVDQELAAAGHPDLTFELDGQSVSQPRHWREADKNVGPKLWLVGQAVALREMSWQLSRSSVRDENLVARWNALVWLLQKVGDLDQGFGNVKSLSTKGVQADFEAAQRVADIIARRASEMNWNQGMTQQYLAQLTRTGKEFLDPGISQKIRARRAERLVLGLDRLVVAQDKPAKDLDAAVSRLFKRVQSIPDFEPEAFAKDLNSLPAL
jgi:hypothetical protein